MCAGTYTRITQKLAAGFHSRLVITYISKRTAIKWAAGTHILYIRERVFYSFINNNNNNNQGYVTDERTRYE